MSDNDERDRSSRFLWQFKKNGQEQQGNILQERLIRSVLRLTNAWNLPVGCHQWSDDDSEPAFMTCTCVTYSGFALPEGEWDSCYGPLPHRCGNCKLYTLADYCPVCRRYIGHYFNSDTWNCGESDCGDPYCYRNRVNASDAPVERLKQAKPALHVWESQLPELAKQYPYDERKQ